MQLKRGYPAQHSCAGFFCGCRESMRHEREGPTRETETMTVRRSPDAERFDAGSPRLGLAVDASPVRSHSPLRKLPPLNSLRTFEVVARHGSFTKAAAELLVTPA